MPLHVSHEGLDIIGEREYIGVETVSLLHGIAKVHLTVEEIDN